MTGPLLYDEYSAYITDRADDADINCFPQSKIEFAESQLHLIILIDDKY